MSAAPATFTPSTVVDPTKERDWPANLGMLDWDSTSIVFTKRSLIEFLKYAGVTVDPNFTNIQKLPRYAKFGKLTGGEDPATGESSAGVAGGQESFAGNDFKPTRRVRDPPGGRQHNIFGDAADDDALASAPPKPAAAGSAATSPDPQGNAEENDGSNRVKPSTSSGVAGLWDAPEADGGFKPTRRVRERPGGKDSISGLWG